MFGRKRVDVLPPEAPEMAVYRKGWILTNGALEYAYRKTTTYPLQTFNAGGVFVHEPIQVFQPPQVRGELALTVAPIYGPGIPAGSIELQALTDALSSPGGIIQ